MYLSKKQVAEKFGISVSTVNNYMRQGMPFYKVGKKLVRFIYEEVEKWIAEKGRWGEMKWKTTTGRRKRSLLDGIYGKEFVDELRKEMDIKERQELKERLKEVIRKCHRQSWGLTVDDFYELLIDNGVRIAPIDKQN